MNSHEIEICVASSSDGLAEFVSRAFLCSPIFAGVDDARYGAEPICLSLAQGRQLVAHSRGELVGAVTVFPVRPASPVSAFREHMQIGLLAVATDLGGRGVGSALMDAAENFIRAEGGKAVALSVTQRGASLIAMYEKRGYRKVQEFHWPNAVDPSWILIKELRT